MDERRLDEVKFAKIEADLVGVVIQVVQLSQGMREPKVLPALRVGLQVGMGRDQCPRQEEPDGDTGHCQRQADDDNSLQSLGCHLFLFTAFQFSLRISFDFCFVLTRLNIPQATSHQVLRAADRS